MIVFLLSIDLPCLLCLKHVEVSEVFQVIFEFSFFRCHFCEFLAVSIDSVQT